MSITGLSFLTDVDALTSSVPAVLQPGQLGGALIGGNVGLERRLGLRQDPLDRLVHMCLQPRYHLHQWLLAVSWSLTDHPI